MVSTNKHIGILGLGSKSTLFYIDQLNNQYNNFHGGHSTCPLKLLNTDFNKINNLLPNVSAELDSIVNNYIDDLIDLNVSSIVIPNITLHETVDRIYKHKRIQVPLIHPIKATIKNLIENNIDNVVLIGSLYTVNSSLMRKVFETKKINIVMPKEEDMQFIDMLRHKVYLGNKTEKLLKEYNELIIDYSQVNNVVIACTELSIAYKGNVVNVYDMARIQISQSLLLYI